MKRMSIFLFAIFFAFVGLSSCGKSPQNNNTIDSSVNQSSSSSQNQLPKSPPKKEILWGDSISTVKENEVSELLDETENALSYESIVFDRPSKLLYRFDESGELYSVYVVTEFLLDESDAIFSFNDKAITEITEKYGPSENKIISTDIGKTITGDGHNEFLQGKAFLSNTWETKDISANLQASPDNTKAFVSIEVEKKPEFVAEELSIGETYIIPDLCEFTVNYSELKKEVTPLNPKGYYTYYPEEDGKTYIDLSISIKNTRTTRRNADQFGIVKAICGDGYEYNGFSTIEESNGSNFTYTNITDVDPLETATIHYLNSIPNELADDNTIPIKLEITILNQNYILNMR